MTTAAEPRAVVSWAGPGEPVLLTLYGPEGELAGQGSSRGGGRI